MNCLSVNCRGCGRPEVVQEICHVVESVKPAVVFLMETKMHRDRVMNLKQLLGFQNAEVVSSLGQSGGLMLLWRGMLLWLYKVCRDLILMFFSHMTGLVIDNGVLLIFMGNQGER